MGRVRLTQARSSGETGDRELQGIQIFTIWGMGGGDEHTIDNDFLGQRPLLDVMDQSSDETEYSRGGGTK